MTGGVAASKTTRKGKRGACCCGLCSFKVLAVVVLLVAFLIAEAQQYAPDFSHMDPFMRPFRPVPLLLLNHVLRFYLPSLVPSLKPEDILRGAEYTTGLSDWDDQDGSFRVALEQLSAALAEEKEFTPFGKIWARLNLHMFFAGRLAVVEYRKKHPEVAQEEIEEPVFIMGTPRSGTSFIHNLIKLDTDRFRAPLQWEIVDPVPPTTPEDESFSTKMRQLLGVIGAKVFFLIAPNFAKVHPTSAMNAEECMAIMMMDARSLMFNTLFGVHKYNDWLHELPSRELESTFRFHKHFLQHLQSASTSKGLKPKMWLLKAPWHYNHLDEIFRKYPDARVISTHRQPSGVIASLSSLHTLLHGMYA